MKKIFLFLALFFSLQHFCKAQDVWQMYPIQVNQVYLNATDSYLTFSTYDSLLSAIVVDSTPVYSNNIYHQNNYGLLAYMVSTYNFFYIVIYDINQHVFIQSSLPSSVAGIYSAFFNSIDVFGNYAQFDAHDGNSQDETETLLYYDIVNGILNSSVYTFNTNGWLSIVATFNGGWYHDFQQGDPFAGDPNTRNYKVFQKGMYGASGTLYGYSVGIYVSDGILTADDGDNNFLSYHSNDNCGSFGFNDRIVFNTKNGLAYISDSLKMHLASDDTWINQWVLRDISEPFDTAKSRIILKDRVIAFVVDKDTMANVYCAAYNTVTHQWVVDSLQSNGVSSLAITNGTITWNDSTGTQYTRGYADSIGWGNFNTPLKIDFCVKNYQSPTNGNLVYVRNYTIGTDSILFDFGDGDTTSLKSQSHLYKNPNGTYRMMSPQSFNYNICLYALGQSNCKSVTFTVDTKTLAKQNTNLNIRYTGEKGVYLIDNGSKKKLQVDVFDLVGKKIKSFSCENAFQKFDLTHQANGIYVIRLASADGLLQKSFKLVR